MAGRSFKVRGDDRLSRTLRAAAEHLYDLKDGNARAAEVVARDAGGRAPRRTGALAGSIRTPKERGAAVVTAGSSTVEYAGPVHWGVPARRQRPQPFISEAIDANASEVMDAYRGDVQTQLDNVRGA